MTLHKIDLNTLSFLIGCCHLVFAVLGALYVPGERNWKRALSIWVYGNMVSGSAFLYEGIFIDYQAESQLKFILPVRIAGFGAYVVALATLLERSPEVLRGLSAGFGVVIALQILIECVFPGPTIYISFSAFGAASFVCIFLIARAHEKRSAISNVMAYAALFASILLLSRVLRSLLFPGSAGLHNDGFYSMIYSGAFLASLMSGMGFLLLLKQKDDDRLTETIAALKTSRQRQRDLVAFASHEFRTPTAMIKASLDTLKLLKEPMTPQFERRLENIRTASDRLNQLANNLLIKNQSDDAPLVTKFETIDIALMARELIAKSWGPDLVQWREPTMRPMIRADRFLMETALRNLIENAISNTSSNDAPVIVDLRSLGGNLALSVADHGRAYTDEEKQEMFQRLTTSVSQSDVRGRGLPIVRTIAWAHGGEVWIADNGSRGLMLSLLLPMASNRNG